MRVEYNFALCFFTTYKAEINRNWPGIIETCRGWYPRNSPSASMQIGLEISKFKS